MAPVFTTVKQLVEENSEQQFLDAAKLLTKFADNIINNPNESKYRKIRLGNPTVESKLLPVVGALECLFEMGFVEDGEFLTLPQNTSLATIREIRSELNKYVQSLEKVNGPSTSQPAALGTPQQSPSSGTQPNPSSQTPVSSTTLPNPLQNKSQQEINQMERSFFTKIESNLVHVLLYEDPRLQQKARLVIPLETQKKEAHDKLEAIKKEDSSALASIDFRDLMLLGLLSWFKNSFFTWVDAPKCDGCGGETSNVGMVEPTPEEIRWQANRVENYKCNQCQRFVRFPRYNHPEKLLETRCGRCGEWANCFTLCCRAVGFEARYVLDWTDHVWTEVYSEVQKRWLHCDPCENVCDKPLLYEAGWGKKLTYVVAFSKDEVQDVSWRYSAKHSEMLSRRNECRESWLVQVIHRLWKAREPRNSPQRNEEMKKRLLTELVEFMTPKSSAGQNLSGRTTGSLAWRLARGETGSQSSSNTEPYIFKLTDKERETKTFHIKYSCARDEYTRISSNGKVTKSYSACVNKQQNIFRKEERDWKMVYLARTEGSATAAISWKFDFSGMEIDRVEICTSSQTFEDGVISWRLCSKNQCAMLTGAPEVKSYSDLSGAEEMTLTAMLSGGKGDVAWQHTQLFRQKMDNSIFHPLDIKVYFK
ncbi:peptide-N(4)-(N-acetyl-beta-glucosaminyl)asparagine amidase-like [Saccostrea echinata]|uniref:peptide-N(4)-(N-acetyl-beta- glucosaminyl)asparagine amidase-like n=1 Tax=Saccostrea echinata TaxID=191078 RepID=UPI002A806D09|nr:peptide-N(4)-(N-acetyl-beta-glucosaminyl)asparagine amidase-like [Saccostrea echinata]